MITSFLKKHFPPILLTIIVFIIAILTYKSGTIISGWDTLHPELDFALNFKRLFFGVWREEQGLGAIAGHSHMADLPRVIIMWFLHWIFPVTSVRFVYLMLCLWAGPLGIYYLVRHIFRSQPHFNKELIAFLTGLFYLLNLSTVQQFYVPFEMFPVQYAFLPWIMLFSIRFLEGYKPKDLFLFAFVTLLATPQAYAAHLWYPFFGVYCLFLFLYFLLYKGKNFILKKTIILVLVTLAVNSFWLLPNLYFIKTSSYIPKESKQNRLYSQEYRLRNREQGYLKDVSLVKGFYFSWGVYDFDRGYSVFLMNEWMNHLKIPAVASLGYSFFVFTMMGVLLALWKREKLFIALFPFFVIPFIFLMNHTFPFDKFFDFLLQFSLSEEALRFVFTKFSVLIIFSYALYFALFLRYIFAILNKKIVCVIALYISTGLVIYCFPMFQGHLISEKMKVTIPKEYFDFWSFMKTQEDGTVLALPLYNFSGWQYYNWKYQGSGLIWFPLKQSILDRDFDRWSISNEQAFREFYYALYANNTNDFVKNLEKFNIKYVFWDQNIISPEIKNRSSILYQREIQNILTQLQAEGKIASVGTFNNLTVFKVKSTHPTSLIQNLPLEVSPAYRLNPVDAAYIQYGDYVTTSNPGDNSTYYPFRDIQIYTDRAKSEIIDIDKTREKLTLQKTDKPVYKSLAIPNYLDLEERIVMKVFIKPTINKNKYVVEFRPILPLNLSHTFTNEVNLVPTNSSKLSLIINDKTFQISNTLLKINTSYYVGQVNMFTREPNYINHQVLQLNPRTYLTTEGTTNESLDFPIDEIPYKAKDMIKGMENRFGITYDGVDTIKFETNNYQTGINFPLTTMDPTLGYVLVFNARNVKGLPLRICIKNSFSSTCTLYDELTKSPSFVKDYFFIPPFELNYGYSVSVDNISYGSYESYNELKELTLIPFPYNFASQIHYYNSIPQRSSTTIQTKSFQHAPFLWEVKANKIDGKSPVLVLNQSYHAGWQAYSVGEGAVSRYLPFFFGKKIENHILVNNWANGWKVNEAENKNFVIIFWPQYLEFIGLGLLVITFIYCIVSQKVLSRFNSR